MWSVSTRSIDPHLGIHLAHEEKRRQKPDRAKDQENPERDETEVGNVEELGDPAAELET